MSASPYFLRLATKLFAFVSIAFLNGSLALASDDAPAAHGGHEALPKHAETVFHFLGLPITNSMLMVWLVAAVIIFVAQKATKNMQLVPSGLQNIIEWIVESLESFFAGILGEKLARRTFWYFATIFVFILFSNWFGLIPGVGTMGWQEFGEGVDAHDRYKPFLRGANADLHMTMAMALSFTLLWFYWCVTEIGIKNFLAHIFAPKGDFKGIMKILMILLFLFVGAIETFSILVRPVALTFRLYGNIYAGENMLETMMLMDIPKWIQWLPALPFYFLELLVGFVQALVFALLTTVFLKLMTDHEEHDHDDEHGEPGHETKPQAT
jgi:F-type H+-transporting ATPase subunit a